MADSPDIPAARFSLPAFNISQAPFLQSWNGIQSPYANTQDQIQQSLQISGVYPGQMPPNAFLGNTPARYAFGRTVPGTSPYVGALLGYMQGSGMPPTGVNMSTLGLQNGTGQVPPPSGPGPYGTPYGPGTFPAPGQGLLGGNVPPPGQPAPPFPPFPPVGDPTAPGGGGPPTGTGNPGAGGPVPPTPPSGGGLLGNPSAAQGAAQQAALRAQGMQGLQSITDPATRYMYAMAYHIPPAQAGFSPDQINALEQSTMGSVYNKKTGQVQKVY